MLAVIAITFKSRDDWTEFAKLYIEQYGHCELPQTSQIFSKYVESESNIVSLKRSAIEYIYYVNIGRKLEYFQKIMYFTYLEHNNRRLV